MFCSTKGSPSMLRLCSLGNKLSHVTGSLPQACWDSFSHTVMWWDSSLLFLMPYQTPTCISCTGRVSDLLTNTIMCSFIHLSRMRRLRVRQVGADTLQASALTIPIKLSASMLMYSPLLQFVGFQSEVCRVFNWRPETESSQTATMDCTSACQNTM